MNQSLLTSALTQFLPLAWVPYVVFALSGLTALATIWRIVYLVGKSRSAKRAKRINSGLLAATQVASFTEAEISSAIKDYVEPDCAQSDPANEANMRQVASVRENVFEAVDRYIETGGLNRHLLVLADSGMGKTTFCLNYYARELQKKEKTRRPIVVIPLGRADAIKQIGAVERKRDTILFLDALDEDTAAIHDSDVQLKCLMEAAADFKNVVVTCRSQFFLNDGSIPHETGVAYVGPRKAGQASLYKFYKLYLLPFTDKQISQYLRSQFSVIQYGKRKRAREMIEDIPELSVRPMLLALIPDLLIREEQVTELWDLYAFMVTSWLERERKWIEPGVLLSVSKRLAVSIYVDRNRRHKERLSLQELREISQAESSSIDGSHLTARSLLNRDSEGNFKFAHRSIMEYLFILAFIDGEDRCISVEWTDLMRQLFLSWGRSKDGIRSADKANNIFSKDLRATNLLPLANNIRGPQVLEQAGDSRINRGGPTDGIPSIPLSWRADSVRFMQDQEQIYIFDFAYDLAWKIPTADASADSREHLTRVPLSTIAPMAASARAGRIHHDGTNFSERLPSIEEFVSLWEAESALKGRRFLRRNEAYWLGDRLDDGSYLACSIGQEEIRHNLLSLAGSRVLKDATNIEPLTFYRVAQRTWPELNGQLYAALVCRVEYGRAEARWYSHSETDFSAARPNDDCTCPRSIRSPV